MKAVQAIMAVLKSTADQPAMYLSDLSDADLLVRPVPNANHAAWQLGHLISAESYLVKQIIPDAKYPELPKGFDEQYGKEGSTRDTGFLAKAAYLEMFANARKATLAAVEKLTDADLDKPVTGNMAKYCPTWGAMLIMVSNHVLMHTGQITVLRRKLGKPVLF
ncbi:MAG TPA: DinB family protein [Gemmataceae bacterium]|nr:DinB family protein [Gemmataceae bacterium]